jgi:hypothetical protein
MATPFTKISLDISTIARFKQSERMEISWMENRCFPVFGHERLTLVYKARLEKNTQKITKTGNPSAI